MTGPEGPDNLTSMESATETIKRIFGGSDSPLGSQIADESTRYRALQKAVCPKPEQTRLIAVANQKGGVGKTTSAVNLSAALAQFGSKVLLIDMDPQGNMTSGLGIDKDEVEKNIYDLMIGQAGVDEVLQKEAIENLDVIPTSIDLSAAEIELIGVDDKEFIIRNAVQPIKDDYDYIIIDCPPSLSMLTINAMTTADSVLVPIQ